MKGRLPERQSLSAVCCGKAARCFAIELKTGVPAISILIFEWHSPATEHKSENNFRS